MADKADPGIIRLRAQIDEIDMALVQLIAKRRDVALAIARIKQKNGSADDEARLRQVLDSVSKRSEELGLDSAEMREIWRVLLAYMIKEQMRNHPY